MFKNYLTQQSVYDTYSDDNEFYDEYEYSFPIPESAALPPFTWKPCCPPCPPPCPPSCPPPCPCPCPCPCPHRGTSSCPPRPPHCQPHCKPHCPPPCEPCPYPCSCEFCFTVTKRDGTTGTPLTNAEYTLIQTGETLGYMTSDTTGRLKFNGLFPGIYEFKETKSPDGYELDKASHLVRISRNGSIVIDGISLADFRLNTSRIQIPTYPFSLTIPDEESKPLAGVTLRLSEGKTATTATTGSDGPAFFGALAPGTYSLAVTDVPEHYKLSDKTYTVIVDSSGQITVDGTSPAEFPLKCSRLNADASADSSADSSADDTK